MKKNFKTGLLGRVALAIVLGIGAGTVSPEWTVRIFVTFNGIFGQLLGFIIPLIIVGFVTPSIADIGHRAGKLLIATALLAYGATFMAGLLSYFTGATLFPRLIGEGDSLAAVESAARTVTPFFTVEMPPFMEVMTALIFAFILGLGMAFLPPGALRSGFNEFRIIVGKTIDKAIVPLLPLYIFGIFMNMAFEGTVGAMLGAFAKVVIVIFALHIFLLVLQYVIAACFARKNPFRMLRTMLPAYFTALGTQSSAATIPVTLRQSIEMGVDKDVAGFVVPLCATIHLSGSTLKIVACAMALMIMHHTPVELPLFVHFIAMLGITMIAAPGIPGGAIMASLGVLQSILGFNESMLALMIALYIAMDSFGTACNVTGDGAIAVILNRFFGRRPSSDMQ